MATKETMNEKINLSGTDAYLRDELFKRNMFIPLDENNKLIRKHAISLLQEWETVHSDSNGSRKCRVIFHASMNPSAGPYVFASVNDKTYKAPYEKEVQIPEYILRECIDRAVTTDYKFADDDNTGRAKRIEVKTPVYPYTFMGYVDEEKSTAE